MKIRSLTLDAKKVLRGKFKPSVAAERAFYQALKRVAKTSGHIVESHIEDGKIRDDKKMQADLQRYSKQIEPWAKRQSEKLLEQVERSNRRAYSHTSKVIGQALRQDVGAGNVGAVARALMDEQVALIQSIPLEAAERAQKIAIETVLAGTRAAPDSDTVAELQKQLGLSTEVAVSRAKLIARTETARASASFTQARAISVGAQGYIWRTTMDGAERKSHAKMNGKFVKYTDPPTLSDGTSGHAGTFPNCRCFQDPYFDDDQT